MKIKLSKLKEVFVTGSDDTLEIEDDTQTLAAEAEAAKLKATAEASSTYTKEQVDAMITAAKVTATTTPTTFTKEQADAMVAEAVKPAETAAPAKPPVGGAIAPTAEARNNTSTSTNSLKDKLESGKATITEIEAGIKDGSVAAAFASYKGSVPEF